MWSVPDVNHVSGTDRRAFGLPSTIRTCDLRLRSFKNELKQQHEQCFYGVGFWCPVDTESCGVGWNAMDPTWHLQVIEWSVV